MTDVASFAFGGWVRNIQSYALPSIPSASELQPEIIAMTNAAARIDMYPSVTLPGHCFLDLIRFTGQGRAEYLPAVLGHQYYVLDANTNPFFGNIDAGFDGDNHARFQRQCWIGGIVHIKAYMVAKAVDKVFPKRVALQV